MFKYKLLKPFSQSKGSQTPLSVTGTALLSVQIHHMLKPQQSQFSVNQVNGLQQKVFWDIRTDLTAM